MKASLFKIVLLFSMALPELLSFSQARIKVACVGNSITEGAAIPAGKKYPDVLQTLLGNAYEVRNFGLGGRTLLRKGDFPYWNEKLYRDALDWQPDIVIIKLGTNDSKPQNWKYERDFKRDYLDFVRSFQELKSRPGIYLCYPLPVFQDNWGIRDTIVHQEILPRIKKVARKTRSGLIDLYTPFLGKANLTYDGIHPNAEGCDLLARLVLAAVGKKN